MYKVGVAINRKAGKCQPQVTYKEKIDELC